MVKSKPTSNKQTPTKPTTSNKKEKESITQSTVKSKKTQSKTAATKNQTKKDISQIENIEDVNEYINNTTLDNTKPLDNSDISDNENEEIQIVSNNKKTRKNQLETQIEGLELTSGVLYVGHLPWGFDETGIKKYFQQFGKLLRWRLPRSAKTGRVKGYAFIEFESIEVAEIAARTMNNYLLFNKILKCEVITDRARYNLIFKNWKKNYTFCDKYKLFVQERNKQKTPKEMKDKVALLLEKEMNKKKKFKEMGIDYDFPGYGSIVNAYKKRHNLK